MVVDPRFEQDPNGEWFWTIRNLGELGIGIHDATARFSSQEEALADFERWSDASSPTGTNNRFNASTRHGEVLVSARLTNSGAITEVSWGPCDLVQTLTYKFRGTMPPLASESVTADIVAKMALSHFDSLESPKTKTMVFRIGDIDVNGSLRLIPVV
ncbi:hypothetical protein GTP55_25525 [Duganella sp. FT109W]|uniref:Uncharacterized protein n=1 Tax=Duganella margarita TaxID=2692170 RepID=A0ABW9WR39_9BURK|nr:hypothetical protein [Duganella margarita]MYN42709.1 hypothetical protein [Duganella margarita]